jgi:hypothetical protein
MTIKTLVSVAELKQYLPVQEGNTAFDQNLLSLSGTSTSLLETYCRAKFAAQSYTDFFNTRYSKAYIYDLSGNYSNEEGVLEQADVQRFPLRGYPVDTGEDFNVYYDPTRAFAESSKLQSADYYLSNTGNTLYLLAGTDNTIRGLKVTYTGGYTTTEETLTIGDTDIDYLEISGAPEDLKMACITQTIFLFNKVQEGNIGVVGRDKHSPEYVSNEYLLCPEAQALVIPYRRILTGKR